MHQKQFLSPAEVAAELSVSTSTVLRLIGKEVRFQAKFEVLLDPDLPRVMAPPNSMT